MPGVLLSGGAMAAWGHSAQEGDFTVANTNAYAGRVWGKGRILVKYADDVARDIAVTSQPRRGCDLLRAGIEVQDHPTAAEPPPASVRFRGLRPRRRQ